MAIEKSLIKSIRFSPEQWRQVEMWAREAGVSPGRYVRQATLKKRPAAKPKAVQREAIRELNRIGVNLNELTRLANKEGVLGAAILQTIGELREALRKL